MTGRRGQVTELAVALTRDDLRTFLNDEMGVEMADVQDADGLLSSGLLDSFLMVNLITYVEGKAGIVVNPTDVTMDNLDSVEKILGFAAGRAG